MLANIYVGGRADTQSVWANHSECFRFDNDAYGYMQRANTERQGGLGKEGM